MLHRLPLFVHQKYIRWFWDKPTIWTWDQGRNRRERSNIYKMYLLLPSRLSLHWELLNMWLHSRKGAPVGLKEIVLIYIGRDLVFEIPGNIFRKLGRIRRIEFHIKWELPSTTYKRNKEWCPIFIMDVSSLFLWYSYDKIPSASIISLPRKRLVPWQLIMYSKSL